MHEHHATRLHERDRLGHRASGSSHERHRRSMPADAPDRPGRVGTDHELDRAFLDWFDARLVGDGPDVRDVDVLDYLVALALYDRAWVSRSEH